MSSRRQINTSFLFCLILLATTVLRPASLSGQTGGMPSPTLYEQLGGYDVLARFVDTAFPRVASHPDLSRLFRGHSLDSQRRQRQLIVDALCSASGGPCIYTGRDLRSVHEGLDISASDWTSFMGVISATAREFMFPEEVEQRFLAMFEDFQEVVVLKNDG
jgi:hemoglobin